MDATDLLLARLLIEDGRSTLKSLAEATGLSVSAVQARVRRLEAEHVVRGYTAGYAAPCRASRWWRLSRLRRSRRRWYLTAER